VSPAGYAQGDPITEGSLYRRIPPLDGYYVYDLQRPSSLAFLPDTDDEYVSMELASMVRPEQALASFAGFGLCEIAVSVLVDLGLRVTYEPAYGDGHVAVWGLDSNKPGIKIAKKIAHRAIVIQPPLRR